MATTIAAGTRGTSAPAGDATSPQPTPPTPGPSSTDTSALERGKRIAFPILGIVGAVVLGNVICQIASGQLVPNAALLQGVVLGALNALFAVGIVLIYRAGRIVNFAQGSLGVFGATLFLLLVVVEEWNFFLALGAAVVVAALTGLVAELAVVRRLSKAPRLALTVVTIGLSQILLAASGLLPIFFLGGDEFPQTGFRTPLSSFQVEIDPLVFSGNHFGIIGLSLLAMIGLAAFFRFSSVGIAVRGAAENDDRAELLGINVNNLSSLVWVLAATLSGLAAVLQLTIQPTAFGVDTAGVAGAAILLRALGAAVVGKMENLPVTVAAAIGIAIFEQCMFWAFDNTQVTNLALLVLIVVVLLVQRAKLARTDEGATGTWAASVEVRGIPHELKDVPAVRVGRRRAFIALFAVLAAYPWVMSPSQTSLGSVYLIYGIVVISLVVLTGWGGQISLGQFGFVGMGAVIGGSLTSRAGMPFFLALLIASTLGAGIAVLVGLPAMRIRGLFLAVTTLAFSVTVATVFLNQRYFSWLLPAEEINRPKFLFIDTADERAYFYFCGVCLLAALWVARGLRQSRAGRVLIAMRENERTAQAYSINRVRTRLATFAISGFLASFAGVLLAHQQNSVRANAFAPEQSIQIFLIAVIGGLGSVPGALTGVAYFAAVNIFVTNTFGQLLASGLGVIVIMLFFPGGLGGLMYQLRDAWLRRVAMRNRIFVPSLVGDYRVLDGEQSRVALAPKLGGGEDSGKVPVRYRIPSTIGVRGGSQQSRGWRYQ